MREARREEIDAPTGGWDRPRKTADWVLVAKETSAALATKSKDLQLAVGSPRRVPLRILRRVGARCSHDRIAPRASSGTTSVPRARRRRRRGPRRALAWLGRRQAAAHAGDSPGADHAERAHDLQVPRLARCRLRDGRPTTTTRSRRERRRWTPARSPARTSIRLQRDAEGLVQAARRGPEGALDAIGVLDRSATTSSDATHQATRSSEADRRSASACSRAAGEKLATEPDPVEVAAESSRSCTGSGARRRRPAAGSAMAR